MRLSGKLLSQLRFNVEKHFIQNPKVKSYPMEALGYKGQGRRNRAAQLPLFAKPRFSKVVCSRALPDITSGPEVWKIVKIRTDWKLNVFLPRPRTLITFKDEKEIKKLRKKKKIKFFFFCCLFYLFKEKFQFDQFQ